MIRRRNPWRLPLLSALLLILFAARSLLAQDAHLAIAAAADLKFAMDDLAHHYEQQNQIRVDVTYGSSGNLFSQIQNGAPFDLFFSADTEYPRRLETSGLAEPGSPYKYALGQIVLWAPPGTRLDLANQKWNALLDASVQKIAIANPEHAPYGRAAIAALRNAGIYESVGSKLVYGENISQAAQFVQSGNAQVGIIAKSLAVSAAMGSGRTWDIPADMHPPIEQGAVMLRNAKHKESARAFLQFMNSDTAREILQKHGFTVPSSSASR